MKIKWKPLIAVGILALGFGAWKLRPDVPPMKKTTMLLPLSGAYPFYVWLNDNEIMTYKDPVKGDFSFIRENVLTKSITPMEGVTALFKSTKGKIDTLLSSIGSDRLLWRSDDQTATSCRYDASDAQTTNIGDAVHILWSNNMREWVAMHEANQLYSTASFYDVTDIKHPTSKALVPPVDSNLRLSNRQSITMTEDRHLLINMWQGSPGKLDPTIVQGMGLGASPSMAAKLIFYPPHRNESGNIYFAPLSGLFCWSLEFEQPFPDFIHSLLPMQSAQKHVTTGLWVRDLREKNIYSLGCLDTDHNLDSTGGSGPYNIKWTPDCVHLSYVYGNALWRVDAL